MTADAGRRARDAVLVAFFLNGFVFASWASRIPEVRSQLDLSNGQLGLLLLCIAVGSVGALPTTGALIERFGTRQIVLAGAAATFVSQLTVPFVLLSGQAWLAAVVLLLYGAGVGSWDVAMNVEGAAVEQEIDRQIMPWFHAGFSFGTVVGAGLGAASVALGVPTTVHLPLVAVVMLALVVYYSRAFLPDADVDTDEVKPSAWAAWREPRTLLIGVMVLALAMTEGTANDWLALALVDGYDVAHWVGVLGFAAFLASMTAGRLIGPALLERHGRAAVLWATIGSAMAGILLIVFGGHVVPVVLGVLLWGVGASLGFPVGMSAAADDPRRAAIRVSVVSTIGYAAFLAGPPLLGFVGDRVGTLKALLVVAAVLIPSALVVPSARVPVPEEAAR